MIVGVRRDGGSRREEPELKRVRGVEVGKGGSRDCG